MRKHLVLMKKAHLKAYFAALTIVVPVLCAGATDVKMDIWCSLPAGRLHIELKNAPQATMNFTDENGHLHSTETFDLPYFVTRDNTTGVSYQHFLSHDLLSYRRRRSSNAPMSDPFPCSLSGH
jgi:hypothetical protein